MGIDIFSKVFSLFKKGEPKSEPPVAPLLLFEM